MTRLSNHTQLVKGINFFLPHHNLIFVFRSVILNLVPPCPQPLRIFLTEDLYDFRDVSSVLPDETSKSKTPSNVSTPSKTTLTKMSTATSKSTFWSDDNDAFGSLVDVGTTHTHASFPASKNAFASAPLILAPSQLASNLVPTRPAPSVPTATQPGHNVNSSPWDVGKTASNDSQLDAFGMPVFSNDNFAAKPASSVTSTSSRTTNATPSSLSGATWFPDTETQSLEAFDGRFEVSLLSGGSSRWFDGNGVDGSNAAPRSMAPTAASNCNASSSGGMDLKSFLPPSFGELHFELKNQICDTFDRWKRDGGGVSRGSNTVFVDDLISF